MAMADYRMCHSPRLSGEVWIGTAKNAVLPIMAAALLTGEECVIRRMPELTDVRHMEELLASCGAKTLRQQDAAVIRAAAVQNPTN